MRRLLLMTCLAGGCVVGPLPIENDGGAATGTPPIGIYRVDIAPATGNCAPPFLSGPLPQSPEVYGGEDRGVLITTLTWPSTYRVEHVQDGSHHDVVNDYCGANLDETLTVASESSDGYTVTYQTIFTNTAHATSGETCVPALPKSDCTGSVELHYTLVQPCAPPCIVHVTETSATLEAGIYTCVCPDMQ